MISNKLHNCRTVNGNQTISTLWNKFIGITNCKNSLT
jgi:hypothetical protein